jgi:hypothetical protein
MKAGGEKGSSVAKMPTDDAVIGWAKVLLGSKNCGKYTAQARCRIMQ